ncbi:MAG: protease complex subunit PrcB family protein [Lachnospiraceae bacterium]|nr:protease complex subunit PrcB family protein [Lachnospiraceae bacterium]
MKKWCLLMLTICILTGCGVQTQDEERLKDLEFTVLDPEKIPEELRNVLEEKKSEPFKVTYEDEGYLYICVGYGEQQTSGYSIIVEDLYLTSNAVYVDTELLGPGNQEETAAATTSPYIVLKLEDLEKSVVFQ